jgi:hypothetical protein
MDERERYFLNGNWIVDWPGRYETSGVAFHYERVKDSEVVHSRGPLQQDLIVMVCPCSMAGPTSRNLSFSLFRSTGALSWMPSGYLASPIYPSK